MPIQVTKTSLPSLEEYVRELRSIWESGQVTNHGPLVTRLEEMLKDYLGVRHILLVCNGTMALQIAIRALGLEGEVITTPFSYVATTSSLVWEGCTPVFADVDAKSLCIDPRKVDEACSARTTGILATHVYGNACEIEALEDIARRRSLKVLFDAAHTFGARYCGRSLASYGDASILSFHATKIFHTGEGGAIITDDDEVADRVAYLRNFGHRGREEFWGLGINGKMSELHAAMGLALLPHFPEILKGRRRRSELYDQLLINAPVETVDWREDLERNYAYYPILLETEQDLLAARERMQALDIYPRRYFYPVLSSLPYVDSPPMTIAEGAARRVLCLPMGHDVGEDVQTKIAAALDPRGTACP